MPRITWHLGQQLLLLALVGTMFVLKLEEHGLLIHCSVGASTTNPHQSKPRGSSQGLLLPEKDPEKLRTEKPRTLETSQEGESPRGPWLPLRAGEARVPPTWPLCVLLPRRG